jgi:hypothetical protein
MTESKRPTLEDVKTGVSDKYLGQHGIHAVGLSRKFNAVTIHYDPSPTPAQKALLKKIEAEVKADGFNVIAKAGPPPRFA